MTHIQVPNVPPRVQYAGNGAQTAFTYSFPIFQAADLAVTINGALQSMGYAVQGAGNTSGGTVTFDTAPANGALVVLERRLVLQRVSDFLEGGDLAASALNSEFDYLVAGLQEVDTDNVAMLRFDTSEGSNPLLPAKASRLNKVLGFDGAGALTLYDTAATYAAPSLTQSGTGAVSRAFSDKARDVVSAKDYGAIGDGIADDTNALINALAAQASLYLPPGTYRLTATLEINNGKKLFGAGNTTILKANSNAFDTVAIIGSNVALSDLTIDGGNCGLRLYGKTAPCGQNYIANLLIKNAAIGIELDGYANIANLCRSNAFYHVAVDKPTLHGVYLTKSGAGDYPTGNLFSHLRVSSSGTAMTGSGIFVEAAKYANGFANCIVDVDATAAACIRIGASSDKTALTNIQTKSTGSVVNLQLDSGSVETAIINLVAQSGGTVIMDNSGGSYIAVNTGTSDKNFLKKTKIADLTTVLQRYSFATVALSASGTQTIDLSTTTYLVDATNGDTTLQLPQAANANSGAVITVKKTDATTGAVLITEAGGNGPDQHTFRLGSQYDVVTMLSNGAVWLILSSNIMAQNTMNISGTAFYKPDPTRSLHLITANAGNCTVELPPANAAQSIGRTLTVKRMDASAATLKVTVEGAVGPDTAIQNITAQYKTVTVMSNGSTWNIVGKYV